MKIATVAGIRSQFMKLASLGNAVVRWNQENPDCMVKLFNINAGQHYDDNLNTQYEREYNLRFDVDLSASHRGLKATCVLAYMLWEIEQVLHDVTGIDVVIVFGDANATLAGALAAKRTGHVLAHVEAGLRTFQRQSFEEINRVIVDRIADIYFLSRQQDRHNLSAEGIEGEIFFVGDLIRDIVSTRRDNRRREGVLMTMHRKENVVNMVFFDSFVHRLIELGEHITIISHPTTREALRERWGTERNVTIRESLPHRELIKLLTNARFGITDSGALQREAYYVGTRLLICQENVFWSNLTDRGIHLKIGKSLDDLNKGVRWIEERQRSPIPIVEDFGSGSSGLQIIEHLWRWHEKTTTAR